jgi:hypothetical protein
LRTPKALSIAFELKPRQLNLPTILAKVRQLRPVLILSFAARSPSHSGDSESGRPRDRSQRNTRLSERVMLLEEEVTLVQGADFRTFFPEEHLGDEADA